jgi:predicted Zn-dependent protease with MMP-like domain
MMRVPRPEFEKLVAEALDGLPEEFTRKLENVLIVVEDRPRPGMLAPRQLASKMQVLGLYRGIPLSRRSFFGQDITPDQITIFQRPIEHICRTREQIVEEVRRTVLHEIGHHFGISEKRLRELGY